MPTPTQSIADAGSAPLGAMAPGICGVEVWGTLCCRIGKAGRISSFGIPNTCKTGVSSRWSAMSLQRSVDVTLVCSITREAML